LTPGQRKGNFPRATKEDEHHDVTRGQKTTFQGGGGGRHPELRPSEKEREKEEGGGSERRPSPEPKKRGESITFCGGLRDRKREKRGGANDLYYGRIDTPCFFRKLRRRRRERRVAVPQTRSIKRREKTCPFLCFWGEKERSDVNAWGGRRRKKRKHAGEETSGMGGKKAISVFFEHKVDERVLD